MGELTIRSATVVELTGDSMRDRNAIDISSLDSHRRGLAVALRDVLSEVSVPAAADTLTLRSVDGYSASLPLADALEVGLICFAGEDGVDLTGEQGGPFRFLIPNAAECRTAVLDQCANVKSVVEIVVS